jgi:TatD DNase family protein
MNLVNFHCHYSHSNFNNHIIRDNQNTSRIFYICCCLDDNNLTDLTEEVIKYNHLYIKTNSDIQDNEKETYKDFNNIFACAGQHPLYPQDEIFYNHIITLLDNNELFAIGEIGFDKRNKDFNAQKKIFLKYCDLATQYNKPIVIHCVGYYYELFKILKHNFQNTIKIFHSFCPSLEITKTLKNQLNTDNVIISFNHRILKIKNSKIILKYIIKNFNYAFETDQTYTYFPEVDYNLSSLIYNIALKIKQDSQILYKKQWEVFKSLSD